MGSSGDQEITGVKQDERQWQERQGGGLQERAYHRAGTRVVLHRQFARILKALELRPGMRHLDLGCGVGHFLAWLVRQTPAEYHGLDLSFNSVRRAQQANRILHLTVGDAERLPYKDGNFDRISCNGSAHHLLDLRSALHEMHRVLAPGGMVVMYEPTATALSNGIRRLLSHSDKYESPADLTHKNEFTRSTVATSLAEAGFTGVEISTHDALAYPLSGMYMDLPLGRSRPAMEFLTRLESRLERWSVFRVIFRLVAWRWLIVATKPRRDG